MSSSVIMYFKIEITPTAEADVSDIWEYIALDNAETATAFILALEGQIASLEQFPDRCPKIPENEILGTSYRQIIYGIYRIIFRITGDRVLILRVFHGSRLLDMSIFDT